MKRILLLSAMAVAFSAHATGSMFGGDTTNNYDQRNYGGNTTNQGGSATAGAQAGAVGVGIGMGGAGGQGGDAKAYGGAGGSVLGSGNSSVKNENSNINWQAQGQKQTATGGAGGSSNQSQSVSGYATNTGSNLGSGNATNVSVGGDTYEAARIPVSTAYAAPLTSSNGTCMGSSSGGAQGANFGFSIGSTWTDSGCDARYDATALVQAGQPKAAIARLCLKAEIAQAMKDAGTPCPGHAGTKKAEIGGGSSDAPAQVAYTDPIIRSRLGLPPLK